MSPLRSKLLAHLSRHPSSPFKLKDLARRLKIRGGEEFGDLRATVQSLAAEGLVVIDKAGGVRYVRQRKGSPKIKSPANRLTGQLQVTKRGLGFVRVEGFEEELVIPPKFMKTALHGDTVAVVPLVKRSAHKRGPGSERIEGEVVEIVKRARTIVVGTLNVRRTFSFVVPDDGRITRDIYVAGSTVGNAQPGDKVVVELLPWEDEHLNPEGKIIELLGRSGDARIEVMSVARTFGLPLRFPPEVEREASTLSEKIPAAEIRKRIDYRRTVCFTIDPEDAKDFDDAISYEVLDDDLVRLGVHIADVSHYVREGSALDREALQRGTSVYMVNEVIPMLPERLSNDLCSLRPDVDRLTYSVFMDIDGKGNVQQSSIGKTVIHSNRRFTYEEVQKILEDGRGEFAEILIPLHKLTQVLLQRRRENGSIDFDTAEAKFRFDAQGLPSHIIKKERLEAHRLVEDCMLLANRTIAEHIGRVRRGEHAKPFVYRVHDVPDPSRLADLANFVKQFGYSLDVKHVVTAKALQRLLERVRGSEVENVINEVALRSMAKAVYSEKNLGHYGLGFKYYTHFTSPIRRYPDLVVHRLLHEYESQPPVRRLHELQKQIPEVCRKSSERERVAMDAERASVKVMQVEYMKRHVGDEFDGVIGGVTDFGMFVEINDLLVEGLVRVRDLLDDYYLFDEKHYALRGRSRGKVYRLGDKVRVRVVAVDDQERTIDFSVVD